jgi:hypothetical protein
MLPTAISAFFLVLCTVLYIVVWYNQGQAPMYSQVPCLRSARKATLWATVCLGLAAVGQCLELYRLLTTPEPKSEPEPAPSECLVLDEDCEEDLFDCEHLLELGDDVVLTYDNACQCPWSPLSLETLKGP